MEHSNGYAEQCKNWSDCFTACIGYHATHAAAQDRQATAHSQPAGDTRIIDHAVHALWQTALPMCDWTRAWPQILSPHLIYIPQTRVAQIQEQLS